MVTLFFSAVLIFLLSFWLYKHAWGWDDPFTPRGVPIAGPLRPFAGSVWGFWRNLPGKRDVANVARLGRVYGEYFGHRPVLIVADPEVLSDLLVRQFDAFAQRGDPLQLLRSKERIRRREIFAMDAAPWKKARAAITPVFSAAKLRRMCPLIAECVDSMVSQLSATSGADVVVSPRFQALQLDVIASAAFGIKLNSLEDPKHPFVRMVG